MWTAFPSSDYYEDSVTIGVSPRRPSRVPLTVGIWVGYSQRGTMGMEPDGKARPPRGDLMTDSEARGFLPGRLVPLVVAVVVTALVVFVACVLAWYYLGGGVWRSEVEVVKAVDLSPQRWLPIEVDSCIGAPSPHVLLLRETDDEVQVKVVVFSTPFQGCEHLPVSVDVYLRAPLGDRVVVSKGQVVPIVGVTPVPSR